MRRRLSFQAKDLFNALLRAAAILLLTVPAARAETLPFKNYTTADGLGHDRVEEIVRDSRGFLWFCTGEGLSRFDGYEFKNFSQAHGLPHRRVMDLIETRDGKYLVATYAGVAVFNPLGEPRRWNDVEGAQIVPPDSSKPPMFQVLRPPDAKQDKKSWTVFDLLERRDGTIWAATLGGLYRLEQAGDEWIFHRVEIEPWQGKNYEFIALMEDSRGGLWIGSPSGAFRLSADGTKADVFKEKLSTQFFHEDRQGQIWMGGAWGALGVSVVVFPEGQDKPVIARSYTTKDGLTANDWIYGVLETSDGRILIGIANGLCEFLPEAAENEPKFRVISPKDTGVISMVEDSGGNLWIGTDSKGALKITRSSFTLFDETDFPKPAPFDFNGIFAGAGSEIFLSEHSYNLIRFDGRKFSAVKPLEMSGRSWGWNQIDFRSRTGEWWFGSGLKVLRYANVPFEDLAQTSPIGVYTFTSPGMSQGNAFFRLFEDSRGDVWMSMLNNEGDTNGITLLRWERATDKLHVYIPSEHGIPNNNGPTAFAEDRAGNIWIGYYFDGLARYRNGKFQMFESKDGMVTGIVNAIYNDSAGRIWIATGSNGILRVDNPTDEKPRLVNLTVADGLSSNQAACLTEDNFGRIYIGTGRGVTRIEPDTGRIKIYSQADGLPHSYVRICGRDQNGALWFTQNKMLARLIPRADEVAKPPPVFIGSVRVNGETARKLSELGETAVENLEFTSEQRQVQIDFLALGFGSGETLRYQYRLDNADWSAPSGQRTVNFNLSPGSYNFEVRAVNAEGVASERPAQVSFTIARPFWQRWWFLLLAAFIASALVYAIYRYRINQIIKLERVRTRIATDLHDDIGSSLSKIAILSEVVRKKNGGDGNGGFEPLRIIADTSREMVDSMSDIVWAINPERDHLSDLIQRMRHFAEEMLDAADIEYEFSSAENLKDISLGADLRREIYLIFKECVNNLAKHSQATRSKIGIRLKNEYLTTEIEDNGRGFVMEELRAETSSAYSADIGDAADAARSFGGNGLRNMQRRAEKLGGEFIIDSQPGKGTRIELKIPVGKKLFNG